MATLVPVHLDDGTTIYVEGDESAMLPGATLIQEASAADAAALALDTAQQLSTSIKSFCKRIVESLRDLGDVQRPSKTTVEFALSISLEGNVYVVKSAGQGSIKITAEWEFDDANSS